RRRPGALRRGARQPRGARPRGTAGEHPHRGWHAGVPVRRARRGPGSARARLPPRARTRSPRRRGAAGAVRAADPHRDLDRSAHAAAAAAALVQRGGGGSPLRGPAGGARVSGRDWLAMEEWSVEAVDALLDLAARIKRGEVTGGLEHKVLAMVFMDPSLRTRASMETAMFLHGGHGLCLEPGRGSWALETELDVVMDGTTVEHIIEAARVLSRYADALAVRCFPKGTDWAVEREDHTIRNFARYATVPVD